MKKHIAKEVILKELGYELWYLKPEFKSNPTEPIPFGAEKTVAPIANSALELASLQKESQASADLKTEKTRFSNWDDLSQTIKNCTACPLHQSRNQAVVGQGSLKADLMIVGEAPGANEDEQGLPFVGRSGQLLDSILFAVGLKREEVYIANIIKCRPPANRNPELDEMNECAHFLYQQINWVKPKLIVTLGAISSQYLLQTTEPMGQLRQKTHQVRIASDGLENEYQLIASYHPAYLLRDPNQKVKAWEDWKMIRSVIKLV